MRSTDKNIFIVGAITALAVLAGLIVDPRNFYRSYLIVFLFCLGLSLGAMANVMLHEVSGGRWGLPLRLPLMAATQLMPLNALLFVPLLFGLRYLYPWISAPAEAAGKSWWLNQSFFIARAIIYFLVWMLVAWRWTSIAKIAAKNDDGMRPPALRRLSAFGLIIYGLTMSLAAVDWIMSLMPAWYSTIFGLLIATSQMFSAMALGVAACALLLNKQDDAAVFHDLGNLLLMYVMTWAYLAFSQFLIIWAEDLPKEIAWYVPRVQTSWRWVMIAVFALLFALPFLLLLLRVAKRTARYLGPLAVGILCGQWLFNFYLVTPVLKPQGFSVSVSDVVVSIAIISLWFFAWLRNVRALSADSSINFSTATKQAVTS